MSVVNGLYEFVFATRTSERERLLAFWHALGFEPINEGALSAGEASTLYGHHAELQSIRLRHAGCAQTTFSLCLDVWGGNLRPLGNRGCLKTLSLCDFEIIFGIFSKYFEKIPLAPPSAAPSGRRRARRRGYFFKLF